MSYDHHIIVITKVTIVIVIITANVIDVQKSI